MLPTQARATSRLLALRRSCRHRPVYLPSSRIPLSIHFNRSLVIHAPGPSDISGQDEPQQKPRYEIIEASPKHPFEEQKSSSSSSSTSNSTSASQDPTSSSSSSSSKSDSDDSPKIQSTSLTTHTSLPSPPVSVPSPLPPHLQHPFDTHAFVTYLEKHNIPWGTAKILMESVRQMIVTRGKKAREDMVGKEDMENAAYLFKAALSELRTELSVRARNDGASLKAMSGAIRREVEMLEQKMKEDVQALKHDIEMDTNNRKAETRTEMKGFDMSIEEINNKFTISLGDLRTEVESAKWDSTRRAISAIVLFVIFGVASSLYYAPEKPTAAISAPSSAPLTQTREMGVGTDDDFLDDQLPLSDERLEKLLREKGVGEVVIRSSSKPAARKEKKEVNVDRI